MNRRPMSKPIPQGYGRLLGEIKERIRSAQYEALRKVNRELISLYWDIGRLLVERQRDAGWGKSVVETLAGDLQSEFPGIGGFSAANLWRMRLFYDTYVGNEKLAPLVREIGWTHNLLIMEKCKDDLEREFYLTYREGEKLPPMVAEIGWMHNLLTHQIENKTIVEYTLRESTKPIGIASCRVVSTLPEDLRGQLPAPDQLSKLLEDL